MKQNWIGVVVLVLSAEIAALIVLVAIWLPRQIDQANPAEPTPVTGLEGRLVEIENSLKQLEFRLQEGSKKESSSAMNAIASDLRKLLDRVDDLGTQIYEHDQDSTRNLMRMQSNIMGRLAVLGGAAGPPKDSEELQVWLQEGQVTLDQEQKEIRFEALIASPNRPLETVAAIEGGPLHEALFEAFCRPWAVRAGLEALGLKPGTPADFSRGIKASGDRLKVMVSWEGLPEPIPLESLILDLRAEGSMVNAEWIFTGSDFSTSFATGERIYIPDESRVVIALTHNFGHLAVVSCQHVDAGNEMNWQVQLKRLPEQPDTRVTIHMSPAKSD